MFYLVVMLQLIFVLLVSASIVGIVVLLEKLKRPKQQDTDRKLSGYTYSYKNIVGYKESD